MRTVLLSFEHLPACSLGSYGERIIATPEFDALASQSLLFENYFVSPEDPGLLELLAMQHSQLVWAGRSKPSLEFPVPVATLPPGDVPSPVQFAGWLPASEDSLLYVECIPSAPWMRELVTLADRWPQLETPETAPGEHSHSPDEPSPQGIRLDDESTLAAYRTWPGWKQQVLAHAAHVQRSDELLSRWLDLLEQVLEPGDLLVLTAATGDPRRISEERSPWLMSVSEPVVHLPLIVHVVEGSRPKRLSAFLLPQSIVPWLLNPVALDAHFGEQGETSIICRSRLAVSVRLQDWLIMEELPAVATSQTSGPGEPEIRLYAKPEDIWEVHDLSRQDLELIEQYRTRTGIFALSGDAAPTVP